MYLAPFTITTCSFHGAPVSLSSQPCFAVCHWRAGVLPQRHASPSRAIDVVRKRERQTGEKIKTLYSQKFTNGSSISLNKRALFFFSV